MFWLVPAMFDVMSIRILLPLLACLPVSRKTKCAHHGHKRRDL